MFGRKSNSYGVYLPPIHKNIDQFTPREAKEYFEWFMDIKGERIEYLKQFSRLKLNYSIESLVPLWSWFLRNAEIEVTPKEQIDNFRKKLEESKFPLADVVLQNQTKRFTLETECIIRDIGMYWGDIFVKNHPDVNWSYFTKPKRHLFVNRPLLTGFPNEVDPEKKGMPFEPIHMTHVRACRLFDGESSKKDLLEIHYIWENMFSG